MLMAAYNSITGCVFFFLLKACDTHMMPNFYKFYNGKAITIFDLWAARKENMVVTYSENLDYTVTVSYFGSLESSNI